MDKYQILKEKFGYSSFRPGQEEIVDATMDVSKRGVLVVAATSFGKSLCFQVPSLLFGGLNIVISPLIALMQDQVQILKAKGIQAEFYNSSLTDTEKQAVINQLNLGTIELLYVAPERFEDEYFTSILERCNVSLFAIDEAHCVSAYGDFRPSYRRIRRAIDVVNPAQVIALTATATKKTQADIILQLGLQNPKKFIRGFYRDNLHLEIEEVKGSQFQKVMDDITDFQADGHKTGIVYSATKKDAEALGAMMEAENDVKPLIYHGGMGDKERKEVQDKWMKDGGVIIATCSLGMGVDKPDIRWILHLHMTGSVEDYAQQVGRAGRDGLESFCKMYVNMGKDKWLQNFFINLNTPPSDVVKRFWEWLNGQARKKSTIEMTQDKMEQLSCIDKGMVGGCISVLKQSGLVDTVEKGKYEVNHFDNPNDAPINYEALEKKRKIRTDKLYEMISFVGNTNKCRQLSLMEYFDDKSRTEPCQKCDYCIRKKRIRKI